MHLGRAIVIRGRTGNPFFNACSRVAGAPEISRGDPDGQEQTKGVYDGDPRTDPEATFLPTLTHLEAIERGLRVMDTTALSLCMENGLPIHVFELAEGNILRVARGQRVGTIISELHAIPDDKES